MSEVPNNERYSGPLSWGLGVGMIFLPLKNSVVPNPSNRGNHGPKTSQSSVEEVEDEEEEEEQEEKGEEEAVEEEYI